MRNEPEGMFGLPKLGRLLEDAGFVGQILRLLPTWLIREADQDHYPWSYLLGHPLEGGWPRNWELFIKAGISQQQAAIHLAEISRGAGSVHTSWREEMRKWQDRGDSKKADHAMEKLIKSHLTTVGGRRWLLEGIPTGNEKLPPPEIVELARQIYDKACRADLRNRGRREADTKWKGDNRPPVNSDGSFKSETATDKLAVEMTQGWLRGSKEGFPGYCLLSDIVLAEVLGELLKLSTLGHDYVQRVREQMKLRHALAVVYGSDEKEEGRRMLDRNRVEIDPFDCPPGYELPKKLWVSSSDMKAAILRHVQRHARIKSTGG